LGHDLIRAYLPHAAIFEDDHLNDSFT